MSRGPPNIDGMVSLKVDNLSYRTSTETLRRKFERYGEIGDAYVPRDRNTGDSRGFGFVRFYDKRDAADAVKGMDGYELDGRDLRVDYARHERPNTMSRGGGRGGRRSRSRSRGRRSRSRSPRRRRSRTRSRSRSPRRRSRSPRRSRSRSARRSRSRSGSRGRSPADRKSRSRSRSRSKSRSRSRSRSN